MALQSESWLPYSESTFARGLVVDASMRHLGLGARLLDSVRREAIGLGCAHLVLETGLQMPLAQRFYFRRVSRSSSRPTCAMC